MNLATHPCSNKDRYTLIEQSLIILDNRGSDNRGSTVCTYVCMYVCKYVCICTYVASNVRMYQFVCVVIEL